MTKLKVKVADIKPGKLRSLADLLGVRVVRTNARLQFGASPGLALFNPQHGGDPHAALAWAYLRQRQPGRVPVADWRALTQALRLMTCSPKARSAAI
jgi:hypothetical protein